MGTVVAAAIALGLEGEELMELAEEQFHRLLDYTLPIVSLVKGARISRNIEETFGSWDIEDLWLPFYCVSTNLTKSRLEVHRRGSTALAIRASVAIPGVLPPVPHEGDLLVDGGVLNNLPFEMMRDNSTIETIIAVDVAPDQGPRARADYGMSVSGFHALGASLRRRKSDYPERHVGAVAEHAHRCRSQPEGVDAGRLDRPVAHAAPAGHRIARVRSFSRRRRRRLRGVETEGDRVGRCPPELGAH